MTKQDDGAAWGAGRTLNTCAYDATDALTKVDTGALTKATLGYMIDAASRLSKHTLEYDRIGRATKHQFGSDNTGNVHCLESRGGGAHLVSRRVGTMRNTVQRPGTLTPAVRFRSPCRLPALLRAVAVLCSLLLPLPASADAAPVTLRCWQVPGPDNLSVAGRADLAVFEAFRRQHPEVTFEQTYARHAPDAGNRGVARHVRRRWDGRGG